MNLNLNYEGFEKYLVRRREVMEFREGVQYVFRFPNNYGASIIKHKYSYGSVNDLWELGVLLFRGDEYELTYDTQITADVIGYLTDERVRILLEKIKGL